MSFNYQPASWNEDNSVSDVYQDANVYGQSLHSQGSAVQTSRRQPGRVDRRFVDNAGRQCHLVCEPPRPQQPNPQFIARQIVGMPLSEALRRFPPNATGVPIRVVIRNGQQLPTTMDFNQNRINVETRTVNSREVITRIVGFY